MFETHLFVPKLNNKSEGASFHGCEITIISIQPKLENQGKIEAASHTWVQLTHR